MDDTTSFTKEYFVEYGNNDEVLNFLKNHIKRLTKKGVVVLYKQLCSNNPKITASDLCCGKSGKKTKTLIHYNQTKFDENGNLKLEVIKELRFLLIGYITTLENEFEQTDDDESGNTFIIDDNKTYKQIAHHIYESGKDIKFKFDFDNTKLIPSIPLNIDKVQRCKLQILTTPIRFDFPVSYRYVCPQCGNKIYNIKPIDVVGTNNKTICEGIYTYVTADGETKVKKCGLWLKPTEELSEVKNMNFYDVNYFDKHSQHCVNAVTFLEMTPGFYDCIIVKINNFLRKDSYMILDFKRFPQNSFILPDVIEKTNYIYSLVKAFDEHIKKCTGMTVYGMYPIKTALVLQKLTNYLDMRLLMNVQVCGSASTGKTTVLKYYGYLLESFYHYTTNGQSTSVPGLRGTKQTITLFGKEIKIIGIGMLGSFKTIHIDEAGDNHELIQNLKSFLHEDNYSYDKAGSLGVFNRRTAHINLSENLDITHSSIYIASVRKSYNESTVKIGNEEKEEWNPEWDLYKPLYMYDNLYLRKIIQEKRIEYMQKHIFWIDGYDYALHERFPFYFYLVNNKKNENLNNAVKLNKQNKVINENFVLMNVLRNDTINKLFEEIKQFMINNPVEDDFSIVDEVLIEYKLNVDLRMLDFYYSIVKLSRLINKRLKINEEDIHLLKYILENTNCKIEVADTDTFNIHGVDVDEKKEEKIIQVMEQSKSFDKMFSLPEDEFN